LADAGVEANAAGVDAVAADGLADDVLAADVLDDAALDEAALDDDRLVSAGWEAVGFDATAAVVGDLAAGMTTVVMRSASHLLQYVAPALLRKPHSGHVTSATLPADTGGVTNEVPQALQNSAPLSFSAWHIEQVFAIRSLLL
jgi:hypothetical protein